MDSWVFKVSNDGGGTFSYKNQYPAQYSDKSIWNDSAPNDRHKSKLLQKVRVCVRWSESHQTLMQETRVHIQLQSTLTFSLTIITTFVFLA